MKRSVISLWLVGGCGATGVDDPFAVSSEASGDAASASDDASDASDSNATADPSGPASESAGENDDGAPDDGGSDDGDASTAAGDDATDAGSDDAADDDSTGGDAELPGDLLDLHAWKLTLPTGDDGPEEIWPPELLTYEGEECFRIEDGAVMFVAGVDGVTTENSSYPRCELRELADDGADEAAWSTTSGRHTMTIVQAITETPTNKPHVVAGQIHDAEDDLVMIRLEGERLFVEAAGEEIEPDLDSDYVLGTEFTLRIEVEDGVIAIFHDDLEEPAVTLERDTGGCYFKAGAYTQSNEEYDSPPDRGAVAIRELEVTHE